MLVSIVPSNMIEQAHGEVPRLPPGFPKGLRVLVVDDDSLCLKVVEQMLRKCDYQATTCINGSTALAVLRERPTDFDLVLCDVYMPDMDGFKLLETVGLELDLPVIMMSSNGETSTVLRGVTHGAVDFLIKPVRIEELRNVWQHVIRRRREMVKEADSEEHSQECKDEVTEAGRKRKDLGSSPGDMERQGITEEEGNASKKPRVTWSVEMHQKFVAAVNTLGVDKAVPKKILEIMNVDGLTRENVASHLQKYRLYLKRVQGVPATTPRLKSSAGQTAAAAAAVAAPHAQQSAGTHSPPAQAAQGSNGHHVGGMGSNVGSLAPAGSIPLATTPGLNGMNGGLPAGGMMGNSPVPGGGPAGPGAPGLDPAAFNQGGPMGFPGMLPGNPMGLNPLLPMGPLNPMNPMGMPGPLGMPGMPNPLGMLPGGSASLPGLGPLGPLGGQLPGSLPGMGPLGFMAGMGMPPLGLPNGMVPPGMLPPGMLPPQPPMGQQGLAGHTLAMQNGLSSMQLGPGPNLPGHSQLPNGNSQGPGMHSHPLPSTGSHQQAPGTQPGGPNDTLMGLRGLPGGTGANLQGGGPPGSGLNLDIPDLGEPLGDLLQGDGAPGGDMAALLHMDVSDMDGGPLPGFPDLPPSAHGDGLGMDGKAQDMDDMLNYFLKS